MLVGDAVDRPASTRSNSRSKGTGPVYFNAYLTNFTLEDFITKAGLEVKVNRKYLQADARRTRRSTSPARSGQAVNQKVEKYDADRAAEPGDS